MGAAPASSSATLYTTLSQFSFSSKHHTPRASTLTLVYCLVYPRPTHTDLMRREGRRGSPGAGCRGLAAPCNQGQHGRGCGDSDLEGTARDEAEIT